MKIKYIIIIILGVIFITATMFSIVNASKLLGEGFKYVFDYDDCNFYSYPKPMIEEVNESVRIQQQEIDERFCINDKKRNIAESLAYLIVSLPLAILFYRKLMRAKD